MTEWPIWRQRLVDFVRESNHIEGIDRYPTNEEINATHKFIDLPHIEVKDLIKLVSVYQPDAQLRDRKGLNVTIAGYWPPAGGIELRAQLEDLLERMNSGDADSAYQCHIAYEDLHPFTDGNGRSGRALWLWQMIELYNYDLRFGFLHKWYYQSFEGRG
jgi:hypothetical protein